jgi:hypothetical protein
MEMTNSDSRRTAPREDAPAAAGLKPLVEREMRRLNLKAETVENASGLDVIFCNEVHGLPNRARMKFFALPGQGRMAVFFYKKSLLPHSADRFSYGCCMFPEGGAEEAGMRAWVEYGASGFDAGKRPPRWMRGVPFDVPL